MKYMNKVRCSKGVQEGKNKRTKTNGTKRNKIERC